MSETLHCMAVVPCPAHAPALEVVAGRTLLERAIATARAANRVQRVLVTTPDDAIAAAAEDAGAEVHRPSAHSGAFERTLSEALVDAGCADDPGTVAVLIDPRFPLLEPNDVDAVIDALDLDEADCAFAAVAATDGLWLSAEEGAGTDAGAVHAMRVIGFLEAGTRLFGLVTFAEVQAERCLAATTPGGRIAVEAILAAGRRHRRRERLPRRPSALVMDFDGVFTDNRVLVDQDGREAVLCNRSDGLGLEYLRAAGLPLLVVSKERNPVVSARCAKLKLACLQGIDDKRAALRSWCDERGIGFDSLIFVGNDINDLPCFEMAGCAVAVADAFPEVLAAADIVLECPGGHGALRELTDMLMEHMEQGA